MSTAAFLAVALLHLMAAISPGPAVLMSARTGVIHGFRAGLALAIGIGLGGVIWAAAALFGLALLFEIAPNLLIALKILGGLWLLRMGVKMWRSADAPLDLDAGTACAPRFFQAMRTGLWVQLANPKPAIMFSAIFVGTVPQGASWVVFAMLLTVVFLNETLWNAFVARVFALPLARRSYMTVRTAIDRAFGGILCALGIKIAST
ncbi:LysE family translocator [Pontivivens insulae]|uniref:Threonine efflux protein n=1 Tax=Pontivivens insulae TaxID=1639689 RepID=A0A2R8AC50_9RHOB|nr:LysE family translocator [Pontivivens insulae]RED11028.1 threonine/homoserine/homoserine lactone efflux protein [Pontivivens insulae]SPF29797.1 Threonine efflux protein [Pontivivens insulae]